MITNAQKLKQYIVDGYCCDMSPELVDGKLPLDGEYMSGSFQVDDQSAEDMNQE